MSRSVLGGSARARQEALEQKAHAHGIDRGDAEAEAPRRVRRRAAALAQDAAPPAVRHDLVHREEVARVVELLDQRELGVELAAHLGRDRGLTGEKIDRSGSGLESLERAALGELAQVLGRRRAARQALRRIAIAQLAEPEQTARGDLAGGLD